MLYGTFRVCSNEFEPAKIFLMPVVGFGRTIKNNAGTGTITQFEALARYHGPC